MIFVSFLLCVFFFESSFSRPLSIESSTEFFTGHKKLLGFFKEPPDIPFRTVVLYEKEPSVPYGNSEFDCDVQTRIVG